MNLDTSSVNERAYHHGNLPAVLRLAAADLIAENGVAGFSLREVARRAGVSHAAPAHHFGDMRGLLTAVAIEAFQELYAAFVAVAEEADDPLERLYLQARAYIEVGHRHPGHCEVMFRHDVLDNDNDEYNEWGRRAYGALLDTITAIRDEVNSDLNVDLVAALCWSSVEGLRVLYPNMVVMSENGQIAAEVPSIGDMAEVFSRQLVAGLLPD